MTGFRSFHGKIGTMARSDFLRKIAERLGHGAVVTDPALMARYLTDQRDLLTGAACAILRPSSTEEVVEIVKLSRDHSVSLVPQGGNTGYCGGATPSATGLDAVVSFKRLNGVRSVDRIGFTISVDAGVTLQDVHRAAAEMDLAFGLGLGSQGSCVIGGNISTNAGGISVLRYGMMRDLVLGLEAVLPDGSVYGDMRMLRKNNTGYDLKQLFIGSEGTLGFVTGTVLKLHPMPRSFAAAWLILAKDPPLADMLGSVRRETADLVTSFEFISELSLSLSQTNATGALQGGPGGALLIELASSSASLPLDDILGAAIEGLIENGAVLDALIATSGMQKQQMWARRELLPEDEKSVGGSVKHDIATPVSSIQTFREKAAACVAAYDSTIEISSYGHVGDGNLHFNLLVPRGKERLSFTKQVEQELSPQIYQIARELGGTFSAEHGVGRLKRDLFERYVEPTRKSLMRQIKNVIDPDGRFNPGAMVDGAAAGHSG